MARFGSASILFLVDGFNLLSAKIQNLAHKIESIMEPSHGCGDGWEAASPVGVSKATVTQEGAFFDTTATSGIHAVISGNLVTARIVCLGFAGQTIGQPFHGYEGDFTSEYEVLGQVEKLQRANVKHTVSGRADTGVILHALTQETTDPATTEPANSVNHVTETAALSVPITSSSVANPSVITCPVPHRLNTGDTVLIAGHSGSTPTINGTQTVTVTSTTTFTIPVNVTVGGTGGTLVQAKSNNGGYGYLQMTQLTLGGYTNALVTIRHSVDNVTFANLASFTARTAIGAERITVAAGTAVNQYLAQNIDFVGAGSGQSATYFVGFARG